jgi:hypothetical protein
LCSQTPRFSALVDIEQYFFEPKRSHIAGISCADNAGIIVLQESTLSAALNSLDDWI